MICHTLTRNFPDATLALRHVTSFGREAWALEDPRDMYEDGALLFTSYADVQAALYNRDLSRSLDKRTFEEGNVRERNLSVLHSTEHRDRRRIENRLFQSARLALYERELFPQIVVDTMDRVVSDGRADLFRLGYLLSVVLSARTAGVDRDPASVEQLESLIRHVDVFSEASAIEDTIGDREAVRRRVTEDLAAFDREFVRPSRERRERLLARPEGQLDEATGEQADHVPDDVLTRLLQNRHNEALRLDDGLIVREVAGYLQAGTHTSATSMINTLDLIFQWRAVHPDEWAALSSNRVFIQRCVHEALRVRPTNPGIRRLAEADTKVGDVNVPAGSRMILATWFANRDRSVYGADAEEFNPLRSVPDGVARWGTSFGAGMHACIGRTLSVGTPVPPSLDDTPPDSHLYGLVTLMVEGLLSRGVEPDPEHEAVPDDRTKRWTRWRSYPVRVSARVGL
jgi:cytochrome P450